MTSSQQIVTSVFFLIYGQFAVIWKLDFGRVAFKTNLLSYKTLKRTKKSLTQLSYYFFE